MPSKRRSSRGAASSSVTSAAIVLPWLAAGFALMPKFIGRKESFIDAIALITAISDLLTVRLPGQSHDFLKRNLYLVDINGRTMDVALCGDNATSFHADTLYRTGQSEAVFMLLVGTLMQDYKGRDTISCGEASKYYIC